MADRKQIATDPIAIERHALGGNSILTIENVALGEHVTLKIQKGKREDAPHFVKIMTGSENTNSSHYRYAGCIWTRDKEGRTQPAKFTTSAKTCFSWNDRRLDVIRDLVDVINGRNVHAFDNVNVWHEGRCCFCGRPLTQPESVDRGYGPDCAEQRGLPYGETSTPMRNESAPVKPSGTTETIRPAPGSALSVACPIKRCGAKAGQDCRRPGYGPSVQPHKRRVTRAKRIAAATKPEPKAEPTHYTLSSEALVTEARAQELVEQGWESLEAAREQAKHEAKGFTRWESFMGLPEASKVTTEDGREYELVAIDADDEDDDIEESEWLA